MAAKEAGITKPNKKTSDKPRGKPTAQNDSHSLIFAWDTSAKKVQAKAFRKKAKWSPGDSKSISNTHANTSTVHDDAVERSAVNSNSNRGNNIKRKRRKDKLLIKQLLKEGKQEGAPKKLSQTSSNQSYSLFSEKHRQVYVDTHVGQSVSEEVFATSGKSFGDLGIHKHLVSNLEKISFTTLTTVQEKAIPIILTGRDTLIRSQTGSGKTLAYAVPIIDALQGITPRLRRVNGVQAIVVVPTRELALQTHELFGKINTFQWVVVGHLCGGENRKSEKDRLRKGINVLIATPGRLLDHVLHTEALKLDRVRCLVLDEADRLLDMGFRKDIVSLVEQLDKARIDSQYDPLALLKKSNNADDDGVDADPKPVEDAPISAILRNVQSTERQTILLSATLSKGVSELAEFAMKEHTYVDALDDANGLTSEPDGFVIPNTVRQEFLMTYVKHRLFTLSALIVAKSKQNSKLFVFMASAQMVEFHHELFARCLAKMPKNRGEVKTAAAADGGRVVVFDDDDDSDVDEEEEVVLDTEFFKLHGSMDQRARKEVFTGFREAKRGVLICTDVAARGLDVPEADCIVQYTAPQTDQDYLHRVGRTGRAGKSGSAVIFLTHDEQEYVAHLKERKVFLKKRDGREYLNQLCELMNEPDFEQAATALQRHYEATVDKYKELQKSACFAYSTWSRYYNSYPAKLRSIFNFKDVNLGHYVTSFALRITPSEVSRIVRGQVAKVDQPRLNRKLANHEEDVSRPSPATGKKRKSLVTSEFDSGLAPMKKKKKKTKKTKDET